VSETFGNLFGIRQVSRAIGGIRAISKEYESGMDAVNDYGKGMKAIADPIESAAAAQREILAITESMGGRLRRVKETILVSASEIGADIIEMILPLAEMVASAVKWFADLSTGTKQFAFRLGLIGLGIATFLTSVGVLGQAFLYLAKGVSYAFPQFKTWTSKMVASRVAVDTLDAQLIEQSLTIQSLVPQLVRIADANTQIASTANAAAAGMNRLNGASGSVGATGVPVSSGPRPSAVSGLRPTVGSHGISAGQWRPQTAPNSQWGDAYRSGDGMMGVSTSLPPRAPTGKLITKKYVAATMAKARKAERAAAKREKFVRNRDARNKKWSINKPNRRLDMFGPQITNAGVQTGHGIQHQMYGSSGGMGLRGGMKSSKDVRNEFKAEAKRRRQERYLAPRRAARNIGLDAKADRFSQRNARRQESSVAWRGGLAGVGTAGMIGGSMVGGDKGDMMMKAGMGAHLFSALSSPKLMKGANNLSEKMLLSAKSGGKFMKVTKSGLSSVVGMAGASGPMALAVAAIAGSWFLVHRHLKKVRAEAAASANEFRDMEAISKEFGFTVDTKPRILGTGQASIEDIEDESDAYKSLAATLREAQEFDKENKGSNRVQGVFRNIARDMAKGGSSIEEINEKIKEIGGEFNVVVANVDTEHLVRTLERDVSTAVQSAIDNLDFSDSTFLGGLNAANEAQIGNVASAAIRAIESDQNLGSFSSNIKFAGFQGGEDKALDTLVTSLEDQFGGDLDLHGLYAASDGLEEFFSRIRQIQTGIGEYDFFTYTEDQAESLAIQLGYTNFALQATQDATGILLDDVSTLGEIDLRRTTLTGGLQDLLNEVRADNPLNEALRNMDIETMLANIDSLGPEFNGVRLMINQIADAIHALDRAELSIEVGVKFKSMTLATDVRKAAGDAYSEIEKTRWKQIAGMDVPDVSYTGEADSKSYVSSLRSGLDSKRNEVIDSIMSMFDDATDEIIDKAEEQNDAKLEILEETHEATLESIEALKDAEIDALDAKIDKIKDYLDAQKEVQSALDSQIDMMEASVTGDFASAAQIQNSLRFNLIDESANSAIEGLEAEKESADELYSQKSDDEKEAHEQREENMKLLHEKQIEGINAGREAEREALEATTKELENMFLGSQASWAAFHSAATRTAGRAGVNLTSKLSSGFRDAINEVKNQIQDDSMWEGLEFTEITNAINQAISNADGVTVNPDDIETGITSGMDAAVIAWEAYLAHANPTAQDEARLLGGKVPSGATHSADMRLPSSFGGIETRHSGGFMGGGAPRDVPAILQTGEYVIQRSAVSALGTDFLSDINSYHTGGLAGLGQSFAANSLASSSSNSSGISPKSMSPEDSGKAGWDKNIPANIAKMFVSSLAQLSGGQYITSGWRSKEHNQRVGGSPTSSHLTGKALDFVSKTDNSIANLDRMGAFFEKQSNVGWVGRPATDKRGGHNDHVHVSYLHSGGKVGGAPKKPKFNVPSASKAAGATGSNVMNSSASTVNVNIGNFNGTDENIDMLVRKIQSAIVNDNRRINPTRSFG
jgi:hypothetical protein